VKIRIVGTEEESEVAADRIGRVPTARYVSRPSYRDDGQFQVVIDARLPEPKLRG
jgi:hypothetical protein